MSASQRKKLEKQLREAFAHEVTGPCILTERPGHVCEGRLTRHHVIPKQTIRHKPLVLGLPFEADEREARLRLTWDPANGIVICWGFHEPMTRKQNGFVIYRHELPARCVDWAEENGFAWKLEDDYPAIPSEQLV